MSIRKGNDIIASKPLIDAVPTQDSTNAVSSGGVYTALQGKQDTISDLATIRSGAAAGATAVQPATLDSYVTLATAQTISGVKTFSSELHSTNNITFDSAQATPIIRGMSGANYRNMIVRTNSSSSIDVGNPNDTINLKGSATNPTYNGNNLALYSDLPTVNNPTITLTQGGVTKGSFTLNQASGDTIALDAGGGSSLPSQTGHAGEFLTTDGTDASWSDKPLVNKGTVSSNLNIFGDNGAAAGNKADATSVGYYAAAKGIGSTAIGASAATQNNKSFNTAVGNNAYAGGVGATAIGQSAYANANCAIQIGSSGSGSTVSNTDANTFKVANTNGNYEIMSANGTIPEARLADTTSATQGQVLTLDSNLDAVWANAGSGGGYHPDLFDFKWADHEVNDVQWLRADTFSWQSGSVYEAAFNDLFNDIYISTSWRATGYANVYTASPTPEAGDTVYSDSACTTSVGTVTSYDSVNNQMEYNSVTWDYNSNGYVTPVSETVAGYSVDVYTGHSGKKIVSWQDESDVASIYTATGVAWYYIIDIPNKRFKLPRTKFAFTGLRDTVGNYVEAGLPNITGSFGGINVVNTTGAFYNNGNANGITGNIISLPVKSFDASRSSSVYGNSTTVQPNATQMYLYFYVGEFTQTALENTAGITAAQLNAKADTDFGNTSMIDYVVEKQDPNAGNNYTWYRKYKSGWVEQGGYNNQGVVAQRSATLPVEMANGNYSTVFSVISPNQSGGGNAVSAILGNTTTTGFQFVVRYGTSGLAGEDVFWEVKGIAA